MAQITSREELEEWLKDKPADWAQVIAARVSLRVLPFAFTNPLPDKWVITNSLALFRSTAIACISLNFLNIGDAAIAAADRARNIADRSDHIGYPYDIATYAVDAAFSAFSAAADAAYAKAYPANAVNLAASAGNSDSAHDVTNAALWPNLNQDCAMLERGADLALVSLSLTREKLWSIFQPDDWQRAWQSATTRLLTLDPTYQVWIDWYNRRIEGHDAAFDIPGDIDRVHDKAILARLADATDEDFWGKGATYVNTTLQGWIDEARLTAELESIVRKLEGGAATQFGSPEARDSLAALRAKLEAALGNQPPAHAPIGHNHPPEDIAPAQAPILPPALREEARAVLVTIDQPSPNALEVAKTLTRWSKIKSTFQHDEFSKNFSGELGTSAARGIVFTLTTLCLLGLAWLKVILGI